jgi:hypothetical protein
MGLAVTIHGAARAAFKEPRTLLRVPLFAPLEKFCIWAAFFSTTAVCNLVDSSMTTLSSKVNSVPAREEWDFSRCPDHQVYYCFTYEYARQSPALVAQFHHDEQHDPPSFDLYGQWHHVFWRKAPKGDDGWPEVIDAPFGFPDKPYLLTRHYLCDDSRRPLGRPLQPLLPVAMNPDGTYQIDIPGEGEEVSPEDLSIFKIDLRCANKPIIAAFARCLKSMRGKRKPLELRGKDEVDQCRADLLALGAYRLIRHFKSAPAAAKHTEDLGFTGNLRLFSEPSRWYKAKARAEAILAAWRKAKRGCRIKIPLEVMF